MAWTEEKILRKKEYFMEQRKNPTGNFTEFVVRSFYYIYRRCMKSQDGLVKNKILHEKELILTVYKGIYDEPDHMADEVVEECIEYLKNMGYIGFKKKDANWYVYIKKELDFLMTGESDKYI